MKKLFVVLLAAVLGFSFVGCKRLAQVQATVDVKVVNLLDVPQEGCTVYMFTSTSWDMSHRTPIFAEDKVVTEKDGIATFELRALDLGGDKETFHFAVFAQDDETIIDAKAATVKSGDKKELTLTVL